MPVGLVAAFVALLAVVALVSRAARWCRRVRLESEIVEHILPRSSSAWPSIDATKR